MNIIVLGASGHGKSAFIEYFNKGQNSYDYFLMDTTGVNNPNALDNADAQVKILFDLKAKNLKKVDGIIFVEEAVAVRSYIDSYTWFLQSLSSQFLPDKSIHLLKTKYNEISQKLKMQVDKKLSLKSNDFASFQFWDSPIQARKDQETELIEKLNSLQPFELDLLEPLFKKIEEKAKKQRDGDSAIEEKEELQESKIFELVSKSEKMDYEISESDSDPGFGSYFYHNQVKTKKESFTIMPKYPIDSVDCKIKKIKKISQRGDYCQQHSYEYEDTEIKYPKITAKMEYNKFQNKRGKLTLNVEVEIEYKVPKVVLEKIKVKKQNSQLLSWESYLQRAAKEILNSLRKEKSD